MPPKVFSLPVDFIDHYAKIPPLFDQENWGIGKFVYARTYSRIKDDGSNEQWYETIQRVVEGTFSLKKRHFMENHMYWREEKELKKAKKMYDLMFNMKFLPGGRGLWSMGSKITEDKQLYAALNNCAFCSTGDIDKTKVEPFAFFMDACMLGVGVGFDTSGAGKIMIYKPNEANKIIHKIEDSREGWVKALEMFLNSYFDMNQSFIEFDFSGIRSAGTPLGHFGGIASGPEPLIYSIKKIKEILDDLDNKLITSRAIVDIMNLIGFCVVSGNVRRCLPGTAMINTERGDIPIKTIEIGEKVLTPDGPQPVIDKFDNGMQQLYKIIAGHYSFRCTANHRMAVYLEIKGKASYAWKETRNLVKGDVLKMINQNVPVSEVIMDQIEDTYDITVAGNHMYYCEGFLTHNSAALSLGLHDDVEFIDLKNYKIHPERQEYGWLSNNSITAQVGMNYRTIAEHVKLNGEPGIAWLENMRKYSRINGPPDWIDKNAVGANPCMEQTLENRELCCLSESFINRHETLEEYLHTLKYAFHYSKIVTLGLTHWPKTNDVIIRNRRIGCSMTGITNFIAKNGIHVLREWCNTGYNYLKTYDKKISGTLGIPLSIKITSIKPSGTVSLLAPGTCSGMHFPESRYYIRRVRIGKVSNLLEVMRKNGYHVEDDVSNPHTTAVVSFPIDIGCVRTMGEVSMWEQLELACFLQENWADNQVSCTVTFDPEKEGHLIEHALNYVQYKLKGVSFLPRIKTGAYPQMPYEEITAEKYHEMIHDIEYNKRGDVPLSISPSDHVSDLYCNNDICIRMTK